MLSSAAASLTRIGSRFYVPGYNQWRSYVQVGAASGAQTITIGPAVVTLPDGRQIVPFATTAAITIGAGSTQETVTPTAVTVNAALNNVTLTATFGSAHAQGEQVVSGTSGFQECVNDASNAVGGIVIDNKTVAIANAAVLTLFDANPAPLLVPAPGAGNLVVVDRMVVENVFLTAAYAAGGAIQATYGLTGVVTPASATIAATFLTSPVANQVIEVAGAIATQLASNTVNKAVSLTAATANFTTGAGSLIVKLDYRVITGLS